MHMAQLMPPTVSCFNKIQIGSTFLVPAHLDGPGERSVKRVCDCVCVFCASRCIVHHVVVNAVRGRYTGGGGDADGQTGLTAGGGGGADPVYSPPARGACYQYAIVTEKTSTTKNVKICGTDRRERNVYTSRSNVVEVRFITSANVDTDKEYYFLLQFEGLSLSAICDLLLQANDSVN